MKKLFALAVAFVCMFLCACSGRASSDIISADPIEVGESPKILIAYFSEANGQYEGVLEKGNTEYLAEYIEEYTKGDMFHIERIEPYPTIYKELTDVAQTEKSNNARPEIKGTIDNIAEYDYVFLGFPIWWGNLPMCVNTFIEKYDNLEGKTIIPFETHAGSGWGSTLSDLKKEAPNATVLSGYNCRGSSVMNGSDKIKQEVFDWLKGLGF